MSKLSLHRWCILQQMCIYYFRNKKQLKTKPDVFFFINDYVVFLKCNHGEMVRSITTRHAVESPKYNWVKSWCMTQIQVIWGHFSLQVTVRARSQIPVFGLTGRTPGLPSAWTTWRRRIADGINTIRQKSHMERISCNSLFKHGPCKCSPNFCVHTGVCVCSLQVNGHWSFENEYSYTLHA